MQILENIYGSASWPDFFWYHGYGLTFLWIVVCSVAILAKKINLYLHAILFFIVDATTIFLVGGAFYRYRLKFDQWTEWSLVKQLHIFGGIFIVLLVIVQHIGGVTTLMSESKKNPQHKTFAFWVTNLARIVVVLGWTMKGGDTTNLFYVSIASAILLIASFYKVFVSKNLESSSHQKAKPKPKHD